MKRLVMSLLLALAAAGAVSPAFADQNGSQGAVWHKGDNPANPDQGVPPMQTQH
ncbi:hypothetical protein JCM19000A_12510 [Silvimonas sp. JCM 19000]